MTQENTTAAQSAIAHALDIAKSETKVIEVDGIKVVLHHKDMAVTKLKELQDSLLKKPRRFDQKVSLDCLDSFIAYVQRYQQQSTSIFIDQDGKIKAFLDWHESEFEPSFKTHIATYDNKPQASFLSWKRNNNEKMTQEEFAMFVEDHIAEFDTPNGEQFLEIASTLQATINATFEQSKKIENGQYQLVYKEEIDGRAGVNGRLPVPREFSFIIQPYGSKVKYALSAWLRYRPGRTGATFWYTLKNPDIITELAMADNIQKIKDALPAVHIYNGIATH